MKKKRFSRALPVLAVILLFAALCSAQNLKVRIKIESVSPPVAAIEGRIEGQNSGKNFSFLRLVAGAENLGERVSDLKLESKDHKPISYKKLIAGEFLSEETPEFFSYKIDLTPPKKLSAMAHVSWLSGENGLLMLDDLLPQFGKETKAAVVFELPDGWRITGSPPNVGILFSGVDVETAVYHVGKNWREMKTEFGASEINFSVSGDFMFSDDEAKSAASEIAGEYQNIFGGIPNKNPRVFLLRFPIGTKIGNWEAETRGSNVVILSSDMPFKNQSIQRLHEQFRHEFFHLWIPNNLALTGNYDWFYEGFALYQSLRTGIDLNRIRFEDFLDTLARAYDLDGLQSQRASLIEASKNRWSGGNAQIYARGMLVAFLCDIAILRSSKGKRSVSDILRAVYQKHQKPNKAADGNAAILKVLEAHAELSAVVERYIKRAEKIDWRADLEAAGIGQSGENFPARLAVKSKLSGRQKDLLDKLGYNNWRKLVPKSK